MDFVSDQQAAKTIYVRNQRRQNRMGYADNKLSIRNLAPGMAADPEGEVLRLLARMAIHSTTAEFRLMTCAQMVVHPTHHRSTTNRPNI